MYKNKLILAALLLFVFSQSAVSQTSTNTPYSRYGYGDMNEYAPTELRGMGGVSIGNRTKLTINPINPASYSSVDSMTFMFDIGASFRYSRFSDTNSSSKTLNANLDYITLRFPVTKWMGLSAGLLPYSLTGYNFNQTDSIPMPSESVKNVVYTKYFNGNGGFSQVYGGLSVKALDHISLGINAYYTFGEINNYRTIYFPNDPEKTTTVYTNKINASTFRLRYGAQFYNKFNNKHDVTLGLIYENKVKLGGTYSATLNEVPQNALKGGFELPQTFGAGINYSFDNHIIAGVDYKMQKWSNALFFNKTDSLVNTSQIAAGLEYVPNPRGRKFADLVRYRIGFNTVNPYYKYPNGTLPNNYTVSFGVGIPIKSDPVNPTRLSYVNASLEYGKIGARSILREDYLKLTISASVNELWFFKRKL